MTKKIAISLPDDIAEQIKDQPNVSAYVTEALRRRLASDEVRTRLRAVGYEITARPLVDIAENDALSNLRAQISFDGT